jgi:hypothetical protein
MLAMGGKFMCPLRSSFFFFLVVLLCGDSVQIFIKQNHNPNFLCSFAAAIADLPELDWWVMNVVPINGPNTLPVIYDRGLIGVAHDWYVYNNMVLPIFIFSGYSLMRLRYCKLKCRCESFDTYPRTYDLLHVTRLFSMEKKR